MLTVSSEQLHFIQIKTTTDKSRGKEKKYDKRAVGGKKKRGQGGADKWELANDGSCDGYDEWPLGFRAGAQLFSVT